MSLGMRLKQPCQIMTVTLWPLSLLLRLVGTSYLQVVWSMVMYVYNSGIRTLNYYYHWSSTPFCSNSSFLLLVVAGSTDNYQNFYSLHHPRIISEPTSVWPVTIVTCMFLVIGIVVPCWGSTHDLWPPNLCSLTRYVTRLVPSPSHHPVFDQWQYEKSEEGRPGPFYHVNHISIYFG